MRVLHHWIVGLALFAATSANVAHAESSDSELSNHETKLHSQIDEAYQQELVAMQRYQAASQQFGQVAPFSQLQQAQQQQLRQIADLYQQRGWEPGVVTVPLRHQFQDLVDACRTSLQGAQADVAMYDRLVQQVMDTQVQQTFQQLRQAVQQQHIPSLQHCASGH